MIDILEVTRGPGSYMITPKINDYFEKMRIYQTITRSYRRKKNISQNTNTIFLQHDIQLRSTDPNYHYYTISQNNGRYYRVLISRMVTRSYIKSQS